GQAGGLPERGAHAPESAVHLEKDRRRAEAGRPGEFGRFGERLDADRDAGVQQWRRMTADPRGEEQDVAGDAPAAKVEGVRRAAEREPTDAFGLETGGDPPEPVPVGVRLDAGDELGLRRERAG